MYLVYTFLISTFSLMFVSTNICCIYHAQTKHTHVAKQSEFQNDTLSLTISFIALQVAEGSLDDHTQLEFECVGKNINSLCKYLLAVDPKWSDVIKNEKPPQPHTFLGGPEKNNCLLSAIFNNKQQAPASTTAPSLLLGTIKVWHYTHILIMVFLGPTTFSKL